VAGGRILVVEDGAVNRMALSRALEVRGHSVHAVADGVEAMEALGAGPFDLVLLDIEMPRKDGFETLAEIKADPSLRELAVIVISGVEDTPSVVRCIEMGALDHLPKPFEPALLDARIGAALSAKRLRDLELEYLEQVGRVTAAAETLEADAFEAGSLDTVVERTDALGVLARTFVRMAGEVRAREEALRRQVRELTIEIDEARQARKVAEITDSDYFRSLRGQAADLRRAIRGEQDTPGEPDMPAEPDDQRTR
jgi:CheY-like chemotaxis protein